MEKQGKQSILLIYLAMRKTLKEKLRTKKIFESKHIKKSQEQNPKLRPYIVYLHSAAVHNLHLKTLSEKGVFFFLGQWIPGY